MLNREAKCEKKEISAYYKEVERDMVISIC